jgi:hypothetical protein
MSHATAPSASFSAPPNAPSENAPSEKAAGKRPEAAAPATEPSLTERLGENAPWWQRALWIAFWPRSWREFEEPFGQLAHLLDSRDE